MGASRIDMEGKIYGDLRITSFAYMEKGNALWNVACSCGAEYIVSGNSIRQGTASKSCKDCRYYEKISKETA